MALRKRRTRLALLSLTLLFLLLPAAVLLMVGSESGTRWLLQQVAGGVQQGVSVERVEGHLLGRLVLEGVQVEAEGSRANLARVTLIWHPAQLLSGRLHVESLTAERVDLALSPAPSSEEPTPFPDSIALPVELQIEALLITGVTLHQGEAEALQIDRIEAALHSEEGQLQLDQLAARGPLFEVQLRGRSGLANPYPLALDLEWTLHQPSLHGLSGTLGLSGDLQRLEVVHKVVAPFAMVLEGSVEEVVRRPAWDLALQWQEIEWPPGGESDPIRLSEGRVVSSGGLDAFNLVADFRHQGAALPEGVWHLRFSGDQAGVALEEGSLRLLEDLFTLQGAVMWRPALSGRLQLAGGGGSLPAAYLSEIDGPPPPPIHLSAALNLHGEALEIEQLRLTLQERPGALTLQGRVESLGGDTPQLEMALNWTELGWPLSEPEFASSQGGVAITGTPDAYRLRLESDLSGRDLPATQWQLQGAGDTTGLRIEGLHGTLLEGRIDGSGSVEWSPEVAARLQLEAAGLIPTPLLPEWSAEVPLGGALQATLQGDRFHLEQLELSLPTLSARLSGEAEGTLKGAQGEPEIDARLEWEGLRWPPDLNPARMTLPVGKLQLSGSPASYVVRLESRAGGTEIPASDWLLVGGGDREGLRVEGLSGTLLDGTLQMEGEVAWHPSLKWSARLHGANLDPGQHWPDLPGRIGLEGHSTGRYEGEGLVAELKVGPLEGTLRGYPVRLSAQASAAGDHYRLSEFQLDSAENRIEGTATLEGEALAARWSLDLPALSRFIPGAGGRLIGEGKASGSLGEPVLSATLKGTEVEIEGSAVEWLEMQLAADLAEGKQWSLQLDSGGLMHRDGGAVKGLHLRGGGALADHQLKVSAEVDGAQGGYLQLTGAYDPALQRWSGQVAEVELRSADYGAWALEAPAPLTLSAGQMQLSSLCLHETKQTAQQTALCSSVEWSEEEGSALQGTLEGLPIQWFTPALEGAVAGHIGLTVAPAGELAGGAEVSLSPGTIQVPVGEQVETLNHSGGTLEMRIDPTGLQADIKAALLERSYLEGRVRLPGLTTLPPAERQPLEGEVQLRVDDLNLVSAFVPELSNSRGRVSAELVLSGVLEKPIVQGEIRGEQIATEIPQLGLALEQIELLATADGEREGYWLVEGSARSGHGRLQLMGGLDSVAQQVQFTLGGERFQVINSADFQAEISPDLAVLLEPGRVEARGRVKIPAASITPRIAMPRLLGGEGTAEEGDDAVLILPSRDVVVVDGAADGGESARPKLPPLRIDSVVEVQLGEWVKVDTTGFRSQIRGAVTLVNRPRQEGLVPEANGELRIVDGTYRSFGQDLEITHGRLLFTRRPITLPEIELKAVRRIQGDPQVSSAGIHVTGTPEELDLQLFSDPPLDQSSVMSYILTGAAPNNPMQVFSLGTYLRPDLYVGYGVDLVGNNNAFNLRYHIKRNFGVEAEVGTADKVVTFSYVLER